MICSCSNQEKHRWMQYWLLNLFCWCTKDHSKDCSTVQLFDHWTIWPFDHATIRSYNYLIIWSFDHIQLFKHSTIHLTVSWLDLSTILSTDQSSIRPFDHLMIWPYVFWTIWQNTIIRPFDHFAIRQFDYSTIWPYNNSIIHIQLFDHSTTQLFEELTIGSFDHLTTEVRRFALWASWQSWFASWRFGAVLLLQLALFYRFYAFTWTKRLTNRSN